LIKRLNINDIEISLSVVSLRDGKFYHIQWMGDLSMLGKGSGPGVCLTNFSESSYEEMDSFISDFVTTDNQEDNNEIQRRIKLGIYRGQLINNIINE
jgi:hypothetical protein